MSWIYLIIAGLFEVAWAIGIKYTQGWTRLLPALLTVLAMVASFYFLSLALKQLPIGTSYATWTGIGTVGNAILGMILFKEPAGLLRILCIVMIVAGIIGLKILNSKAI